MSGYRHAMRVWIDISNSPQVPFFRPLIGLLRGRGHDVDVTTREYAQTIELLELHGIAHDVVGPAHGGAGAVGKARAMTGRLRALRRYARGRDFDVALSHASHELPMVARPLGVPASYAFDYEFAKTQHRLGCHTARRIVVPEAIPQDRLDRLGAHAAKVRRYPGLKEEYYLHGFTADASVLDELGVDPASILVVVRTPPEVSLYHRHANPLFGEVIERLGRDAAVRAVVLPRTAEQRSEILARGLPSIVVPEHALDAQRLVALSDLVVSAGGTMNREAVALGVTAYTTFAGELGAVDEMLIREGRLRVLASPAGLELSKRAIRAERPTRDPSLLLDLMLSALEN
jgi:predicted glycosyltransferase